MLVPFQTETLSQQSFLREEVRFHLLHRISEASCAVALQAEDGGAVAVQNPGFNLWLWIDSSKSRGYAASVIGELAEYLHGREVPGVVSAPEHAFLLAEAMGRPYSLSFRLMAYACPAVKPPSGVAGRIRSAGENDTNTVAGFLAGFNRDCFGTETAREDALQAAHGLIQQGTAFLWETTGDTVSLAAINHRSLRHARIGNVYTPPDRRRNGYAGALVAALSRMILSEGRTPVLYADLANPTSNSVYRSIGYVPMGEVVEYAFQ